MASIDADLGGNAPTGLRARQREYTRTLLIDAALEVFSNVGYAAATVGQVADAAGTSRPTFYQYFSSKAEIAVELMGQLQTHFEAVFARLFEADPITLAVVRSWVRDAIDLWDPANTRVSVVDQATILEPEVRGARDVLTRTNIDRIAEFLRRHHPELSRSDANLHACHLLAEFHVLDLTHLLGVPATSKVTVHALADSWWSALKGT